MSSPPPAVRSEAVGTDEEPAGTTPGPSPDVESTRKPNGTIAQSSMAGHEQPSSV